MKILFLGAPGSGKSTQGQILANDKGIRWISSGELCRNSGDPKILEIIRGAKLIGDDTMGEMVVSEIKKGDAENFILDGFPRNRYQCEILEKNKIGVDFIIEISVSQDELFARAMARGREQDSKEVLFERIKMYEESRDEIFSFYRDKGVKIVTVDGVGSIEEIAERVKEVL